MRYQSVYGIFHAYIYLPSYLATPGRELDDKINSNTSPQTETKAQGRCHAKLPNYGKGKRNQSAMRVSRAKLFL